MVEVLAFSIALLLCAFYSGFETGLYSSESVRLRVSAATGDQRARRLLRWMGQKGRVVVLLLLGNNIAHWLVSHAGGQLVAALHPELDVGAREGWSFALVVPVVFVFGEVVPKSLFMRHPGSLMRWTMPLFEVSRVILWLPATLLRHLLRRLFRGESEITGLLGREEVSAVLAEAEAAGQVSPVQKELARRVLELRRHRLEAIMVPLEKASWVTPGADAATVRAIAGATGHTRLLVRDSSGAEVHGYVSVHEMARHSGVVADRLRDLPTFGAETNPLGALDGLRRQRCPLGLVRLRGRPVGIVSTADIVDLLFRAAPTGAPPRKG